MATITLPAATTAGEQVYIVEGASAGTSTTVAPTGADFINGVNSSVVIPAAQSFLLYCNGIDGYTLLNYANISSTATNIITAPGNGLYATAAPIAQSPSGLFGGTATITALSGSYTYVVDVTFSAGTGTAGTIAIPNYTDTQYDNCLLYIFVHQAVNTLTFSGTFASGYLPTSGIVTTGAQMFLFSMFSGGNWARLQ